MNLTLDDAAASSLPQITQISSGTFKPTNYTTGDTFPAPAPAGPYNIPAPAGSATFASIFNGTDPNGTWSLYVVDDAATPSQTANIAGGWITTAAAAATTTTVSSNNNPSFTAAPNNSVTFTATVTSSGNPVTESNVSFNDGASAIGGCSNTNVNGSGQATCTTSFATEGNHVITATYNSTVNFGTSNGNVTRRRS